MGDLQETLLQDGDGAGGNNTYGTNSQLPAASPFQDRPSTDVLEAEEGRAGSSTKDANAAIARRIALSIYLSLAANVLLMAVKTVAFVSRFGCLQLPCAAGPAVAWDTGPSP